MYLTQSDRPTPKKIESNQSELPKPSQIKYFLDQYVQGQENAKIALATAVYCHFLCVACRNAPALWESDNDSNILLSPHHVLLIGASGSGKSYLVQLLSEFLGVPYSFVSATTLVQTGYVGTTIEKMIQSRYADCGKDLQLAQTGILFIDEIDKTRANSSASGPDVSGEGVQHALLTFLDGKPISIAENGNTDSPKITFDPSGLLIICAGAFGDLPEIVRQRIGSKRSLGFEATETTQKPQALTDAEALGLIQTEDLVSFGLIREFIGRFSAIAPLAALTTDDLLQILVKSKSSIVQQQKQLFQLHGIDLIFTDEALRAIANKAIELNTGARGLTRIVKVTLQDISFRLPDLAESGISQITITEETVNGQSPAIKSIKSKNSLKTKETVKKLRTKVVMMQQKRLNGQKRFSSPANFTESEIRRKIEELKLNYLGWENTQGSARKWWEAFEKENQAKLGLVLRLAEELAFLSPSATITEFFQAYVYSNTDNLQGNLHYLQYIRLKKMEEQRKRDSAKP